MNASQKEYIHRINKVIDYVEQNFDRQLDLKTLAGVAHFSPFHFHRIFSAMMGETVNDFIKRKRIERAASLLLSNPDIPVSDIAYDCGFNSFPVFCRVFKDHFQVSATAYREKRLRANSKIGQFDSKNDKSNESRPQYLRSIHSNQNWRLLMKNKIKVKEMRAMDLIYCRHTGAFNQIGGAYEKLMRWAGPRGLLKFPETKTVTVYHDDPNVTEMEKVRQSACITVDQKVETEGEIGEMSLPANKCVVGHFEISDTEFQQAWDSVCLWMSESGYQPADGFPYELYHNDHNQHPERKFILDICIPVKPL